MNCDFPLEKCTCPISKVKNANGDEVLRIQLRCEKNQRTSAHDLTIRPGHWEPINKKLIEGDTLVLDSTLPDVGYRLTWTMVGNVINVSYVDDKCMLPNSCDCYHCIGIFPRPEPTHTIKHPPISSEVFTLVKLKADKKCNDCGSINLYFRSTCWRCNEKLIKRIEVLA